MRQARRASRWSQAWLWAVGGLCAFFGTGALGAWVVLVVAGCGDDGEPVHRLPIAVVSAFPAELAPIVARAQVVETVSIGHRQFRRGRIGQTEVVLLLTGIGMANAEEAVQSLLARFPLRGVVVSGVAGSSERIGDVVVPSVWRLPDGGEFAVDPYWQALATNLADTVAGALERCTEIPDRPGASPVCLPHRPALIVGGVGSTNDPFAGQALPCREDGGDVFGCDVEPVLSPMRWRYRVRAASGGTRQNEPQVEDMETAVVARAASRAGLPFIAFRAVSDGAGDPLGLPGFPAQFFVYYRLAARNAAQATVAFLQALP